MREKLLTKLDLTRTQSVIFAGLGLVTAFVYMVGLGINQWANAYYSAAAQAGSQNWEAFFFGSFNPTNSITVDKPPLSIWFMAVSVKLFGLNSYAIMLPQALMGVVTVLLLAFTIKRYFGFTAGLFAGLAVLVTPVAALMFRFNNPDALLTLLMVFAIWTACRLNEQGHLRWAVILGAVIGLGFMTKTFQAALILPALFITFVFFGAPKVSRRLLAVLITAVMMVGVGGLWFVIASLVPATDRPYIGSSKTNSVIDLAFGYNGVGRLVGMQATNGREAPAMPTSPDLFRVFTGAPGGAVGWFIPLALATFVIGLILFFRTRKTSPQFFITVMLGITLITMVLLFDFMKGIFHGYYTVQMVPAIAGLVGIFYHLTQRSRTSQRLRIILAVIILGSGVYAGFIPLLNNDGDNALVFPLFALAVIAALVFAIPYRLTEAYSKFLAFAVIASLAAGPASYTFSTITISQTGSDVRAGPYVRTQSAGITKTTKPAEAAPEEDAATTRANSILAIANLANVPQIAPVTVATLNQRADTFIYPAAAVGGQNAAAYQLALNKPVLLMGGFNGIDPTPTLAQFKTMVQRHEIHYFVLSSGGQGKTNEAFKTTLWIMDNFPGKLVGNVKLYDLTQPSPGAFN